MSSDPERAALKRERAATRARNDRARKRADRDELVARGDWPQCPLRGCEKPAGMDGGGCCRAHGEAIAARKRARAQGYVLLTDASRKLKLGKHVLRGLHDSGRLPGRVEGRALWLERCALAVYAFSRPRCVVEGCDRRALGPGPGCSDHPQRGVKRSDRSRQHISEGLTDYWASERGQAELQRRAPTPVHRICEWCEQTFEISARRARHSPGRFCSREHARLAWVRDQSEHRLPLLWDGQRRWIAHNRHTLAQLKAETGLLDRNDVARILHSEKLWRSQPALTRAIAKGRLKPTPNDLGMHLFSPPAVDEYIAFLRSSTDWRVRRWEKAKFRGRWHLRRHKSTKVSGQLAREIAEENGKKTGRPREFDPDTQARIRDMAARGKSQRQIATTVGVSHRQVRTALSS